VRRSIHRLAELDLAAAVKFYRQEAGVGVARRFVSEFERAANLLERHPGIGTPTADDRRSFPLTDFPYSIIYRGDEAGIRILVVRHQSRDPEHGEARR
jgi:plasmid stabilization system protein ParE